MREFTIDLSKALSRGLTPFPGNELRGIGLYECYNQVPTENGLEDYKPLRATGCGASMFFHYLRILDQGGVPWYWYPVFDGHILSGDTIPSEPTTGLDPLSLINEDVQWVEILDENFQMWKMYPDQATGFTRVTDTTPLSGVGLESLVWRGTTTEWWTVRFDDASKTRYAVKV